MKRNIILSAMLLVAGFLFAQQPVITFTTTEHDFGKINESDGKVSTIFEFKNEGMEPLVLSNVKASCGCTTPTWTKTPVEPGAVGTITVTYNPNGRPGKFQKTITVTSNAVESPTKLYIKGEVIPKQAKPVNKYPIKMGALSVAKNSINYGTILKGKKQKQSIEYANLGEEDVTVAIATAQGDPIIAIPTLEVVKKGQSGQIDILFDADADKVYGPQEYTVYVVVNGEKNYKTEEFKITLNANVEEDFSLLTAQQRQNAPIVEVEKTFDLGVLTSGKKVKKTFTFKNVGLDPLQVRALVNMSSKILTATVTKKPIKSGKTGQIIIETSALNGTQPLKAGDYRRTITLITNDPQNPKMQITLIWTVQ